FSAGPVTFRTGEAGITVDQPNNNFSGPVSLFNSGNNSVMLRESGDLVLGTCSVGGICRLTASSIGQSVASTLTVGGPSHFTSSSGEGGILLNNRGNVFNG